MGGALTYSRGALVLHFLRHELGDAAFWNGLREFTRAGAGKSVDTKNFRAAMERASGRKLDWISAQWADSADPEDLVARHRQEPGAVVIEIEQRQPRPWRIPLTVVVETETERVSRRVVLREARETLRFPATGTLLSVRIDGDGTLPRFVRHERPLAMLLHQARFEPDQSGRVEALTEIERTCAGPGKEGCQSAVPVLEETAAEDSSRLVRQVAARILESTGLRGAG
jgi:aminopeptidase N